MESDVLLIAPRMRNADREECMASIGLDPLGALGASYFLSNSCYTATLDDIPELLFGVCGDGDYGTVWLLGTETVFLEAPKEFCRKSIEWLDKIKSPYKKIGNLVDARNTVHIRWLKWMGFNFIGRCEEFGVEKRPFLEFELDV